MGMNVQKVSFGNTPVAGTTPGAAQQAPVKKADKGDVVVIGGKEFTKKQVAIGGAGILAGAAVLATGIVSYMRGKTAGVEGFAAKIKEGFHTLVNKEARAKYAEEFGKKAQKAAEGTKDKAADAVAEGAKDKAGAAAADNGAAAKNATDAAANKGAAAQEGAEKAATEAPKTSEGAAEKAEKPAAKAGEAAKNTKSEELEQKVQDLQAKLDEQTKKLADLKAEQATLNKRAGDLPGVIQKQKDEVELAQMAFDEASKKERGKLKQTLDKEKQKLAKLEQAQKDVAARKRAVDGQIKGLESEKAVKGREKMAENIAEIKKQAATARKDEFLTGTEEYVKLTQELESLQAKRTAETDTAKQATLDKLIKSKEEKIASYKTAGESVVNAKIALEAKDAEISAIEADIAKAAKKADKEKLSAQLKTLKGERSKLNTAYQNADNNFYILISKATGGVKPTAKANPALGLYDQRYVATK